MRKFQIIFLVIALLHRALIVADNVIRERQRQKNRRHPDTYERND